MHAAFLSLLIASIRRLQVRDMETAKHRHEKLSDASQRQTERQRKVHEYALALPRKFEASRDANRILLATKASDAGALGSDALDAAEYRREHSGAHSGVVAMSGRDLQFMGRAVPVWLKPK